MPYSVGGGSFFASSVEMYLLLNIGECHYRISGRSTAVAHANASESKPDSGVLSEEHLDPDALPLATLRRPAIRRCSICIVRKSLLLSLFLSFLNQTIWH